MNTAFLSLGSNLGDRLAHFLIAENHITKEIGSIIKSSSVYETEPWGYTDQPAFLNNVIEVKTNLNPTELLKAILAIEITMGRIRTDKWHERIIDIDILFYEDLIVKENALEIPHPFIQKRKFVLMPLSDIANTFIHPVLKKSIKTLVAECNDPLVVNKIA
jgi:2-amino-4-hydroxy-6-hydroxymethyldihydropteridine diphosphokinase